MELTALTLKMVGLVSLLLIGCFALLPSFIANRVTPKFQERVLAYANCLAGGIFFAVAIIHLLPESRELFEQVGRGHKFTAYIVTAVGFFLIFFFEKVLFSHSHQHHNQIEEISEESLNITIDPLIFDPPSFCSAESIPSSSQLQFDRPSDSCPAPDADPVCCFLPVGRPPRFFL